MQRIEVKNFGPLKHITLDIKDYMVFIGPQASGKSTLAKLIDFSLRVRKIISDTLIPDIIANKFGRSEAINFDWQSAVRKHIKELFSNAFPTIRFGSIKLIYSDKYQIDIVPFLLSIDLEKGIIISEEFENELSRFQSYLDSIFSQSTSSKKYNSKTFETLISIITEHLSEEYSTTSFNSQINLVETYIPSGRSIISLISNSLTFIDNNSLDFYNEEFVKLTNHIRKHISASPLSDYIGTFANPNSFKQKFDLGDTLALSKDFAFKVLKGYFYLGNNGDAIIHDPSNSKFFDHIVPLKYTSSGQQESSWLINTIQYLLAESLGDGKNEYNTIIEEPEAHLFPEAQRDMTYLISLLANQKNSKVLITTHSPYVLASLNNLIKAYLVGQEESKGKSVGELIHPLLWVNPKHLYVGYLDNGDIRNIIDKETNLISHEELDGVSVDIMSQFDDLLEIQYA